MAVKKSRKSALDYDPLSWLKEEDTNDAATASVPSESGQSQPSEPSDESLNNALLQDQQAENQDTPVSVEVVDKAMPDPQGESAEPEIQVPETMLSESADSESEDNMKAETVVDYIHLDSELTMKNVAEFKQQLDHFMRKDMPVAIDATDLQKIDSSGLQLLYSLQKTLAKNSATITWKQQSDVVDAAAAIIAMDFNDELCQKDTAEIEAEQGFGFF